MQGSKLNIRRDEKKPQNKLGLMLNKDKQKKGFEYSTQDMEPE